MYNCIHPVTPDCQLDVQLGNPTTTQTACVESFWICRTKNTGKKEGGNIMENKQQRTAERRKEVTQWETKNRAKKEGGNTMGNKDQSKEGRR